MTDPHRLPVRVYYEDTDLAGIVYYANYLKFIERGRSEFVADLGIDQRAMKAAGLVFAVRRVVADYLRPARFADDLVVETRITDVTPVRLVMDQAVTRGDEVLFTATVTVVCIADTGRPARLPAEVRARLTGG